MQQIDVIPGAALEQELDAWSAAGRRAPVWWRDDDLTHRTPAFDRLLELRRRHDVPLALAVIPARARRRLASLLARQRGIVVWQHGWAHTDRAGPGAASAELGPGRSRLRMAAELLRGRIRLDRIFGRHGWQRVLVPPYNVIAEPLVDLLPMLGYHGLSAGLGPRLPARAGSIVNAHVDLIDWAVPRFAGEIATTNALVESLRLRRLGQVDASEPVGIMSHHLAHDDAAWAWLDATLGALVRHPGVRFVDPAGFFQRPGPG
jgi:peptidoglycan/xylan/chitin deacetylase (PgdA/CDA1 family)